MAKTIESSAELLSLLEKSSLLQGERLEAARTTSGAIADSKGAARQLIKDGLITTWQANQLLGGFAALTIGSYKLMDQIGKGELGRVYLAEHSQMGNRVALKVLASKSASDPKQVERFLAEARAAGEFEHQNVLRVLDVSSDPSRPFVVTEFVPGGDLEQRVEKRGPLPAHEAAALVAQTAEGMAYVHGKNVLHRDLKPANLLVDDKGIVKIQDVGVGHLRQADKPGDEATGVMLLSALGYMSPEQVRGKELDARSDVYALGGTLYFLLTGRVPYTAASNEERDLIRETKRPVPVDKLKPDLPVALVQLCDQMMALKGSDRPAGMQEVAARLRRFLSGEDSDESTAQAAQGTDLEAAALQPNATAEPTKEDGRAEDGRAGDVSPLFLDPAAPANLNSPAITAEVAETVGDGNPIAEDLLTGTQASAAEAVKMDAQSTAAKQEGGDLATPEKVVISLGNGTSGPPTAAVMPKGFKIQKKKKAEITAAAGGTEVDPALASIAQRGKRQRRILIGTAIASLVVIALGIAVMAWSGSGDTTASRTDAGIQPAAGTSAGGPPTPSGEPSANDPENLPDPESIPDAQMTSAAAAAPAGSEKLSGASPAPTDFAGPPAAAAPSLAPATNVPGASATVPAAVPEPLAPAVTATPAATPAASTPAATEPAVAVSATPMPTPSATVPDPTATAASVPAAVPPAATTPEPSAPPPPTSPASTPPATSPVNTVAKEEEPKVEEKKDAAKGRAKSAKTFEIAPAVDLPRLPVAGGSAPPAPSKVLGKVNIDPKDACFLSMYGGDKALRGSREFLLRNAAGGTAPRDWEFVAKDGGGEETVIAKLALPESDLQFEWTEEGLKDPTSSGISNCVLKITAGQEKPYFVALRTVARMPPMTVENIERSPPSVRFNLESVPDSAALRFEPSISGQKILFEAGGADLTKADPWIFFGESKEQAPLGLKLDVTINNRGIQISAVPYVLLPGEKPQKLTPVLRKKLSVADLQRQVTILSGQVEAIKKLKKEDQQKFQNELNLAGLARENLDKLIQRIQSLDAMIQQLNGAQIQFRISYDTGETQVALAETSADAAAVDK